MEGRLIEFSLRDCVVGHRPHDENNYQLTLFFGYKSEVACGSAVERACAYWTSGPGMMFFWKNQKD
jgi:hypothetical protein